MRSLAAVAEKNGATRPPANGWLLLTGADARSRAMVRWTGVVTALIH
jgi:hypothetical protein